MNKDDIQNSFTNGERYQAYVKNTNEKRLLKQYSYNEYLSGNLPIRPNNHSKILDLGCGTGANLEWLMQLFKNHDVYGIDRSSAQLQMINIPNANIEHKSFEDISAKKYDFILVSHVLQYIDTKPEEFIAKVYSSLNAGGEAWFVQQTKKGMYEIINSTNIYLENPRFKNWLLFDDYVQIIDELHLPYSTEILNTSFNGINFKNPSQEDKLRLEFMLSMKNNFDEQPIELKHALRILPTTKHIYHPNGIIKIRR